MKHASGVKLLVKVGDGADPETFTVYCSINAQRGISFSSTVNDFDIPDCDDPEQIAWVAREKQSLSVSVTGAGLVNTPDLPELFNWWKSKETKNVQVIMDVPASDGGVIFQGAYHLTEFEVTGNRGAKAETSMTLMSDGEITATDNS